MIPLNRATMVYSMIGYECGEKPIFRSYSHAIAYDPEDHSFAAIGLSVEQYRGLDNIVLKYGDGYHPKWAGYILLAKSELVESFRQHFGK